jgi:hypothetical protein
MTGLLRRLAKPRPWQLVVGMGLFLRGKNGAGRSAGRSSL